MAYPKCLTPMIGRVLSSFPFVKVTNGPPNSETGFEATTAWCNF